ncbi:MAG: magnesium chelatase ATPase subunit D, partial [Pseudomonadota bacterium]
MSVAGDIAVDSDDVIARGLETWATALRIIDVFAVAPAASGGIWLQARSGPVRDHFMSELRRFVGADVPWRRIPVSITDDRLLGGLDLTATLSSGSPVFERGLLADLDGGICVVPMAERIEMGLAARLASVMDSGSVVVERDGLRDRAHSRFGLVAIDEAASEDDAQLAAKLTERLAFRIDLSAIPLSCVRATDASIVERSKHARILDARRRVDRVDVPSELMVALAHASAGLGVYGTRPLLMSVAVARAIAALDGRDTAEMSDAALAGQWVLAHRATQLPVPPEPQPDDADPPEDPPEQDGPDDDKGQAEDEEDTSSSIDLPDELVLDAVKAAVPEDLLARLMGQAAGRERAQTSGPAGVRTASAVRGRP